jgi:hypothetical protein
MVFRAKPGATVQSMQRVVDCQLATSATATSKSDRSRLAWCPLAIRGVTARVQQVPEGFAVVVSPTDVSTSNRIAHSVTHGRLAQELARFESSECAGVAPQARAACPLLGPVTGISDLTEGVRVEFAASVPVESVLAGMRCHYSFALARGFAAGASACPLYVRGLRFEPSTDGRGIDITVMSPAKLSEVRERVREEAVFTPETCAQK